jgi:hypothetical protein
VTKPVLNKSASITPPRPNYDAWFEFVLPQEIGMQTLEEYYGVRKADRLAAEIMRDMALLGSFPLPPGVSIDDFHVYISNDWVWPHDPGDDRRCNWLFIRRSFPNGNRPRARVPGGEPRLFIQPQYKMGSTFLNGIHNDIAEAMAVLCTLDGSNSDTFRKERLKVHWAQSRR